MKGRLRIDFQSLLQLIALVTLCLLISQAESAPAIEDEDANGGCYYMFNHYGEGDRILTNEPCLNCTCHNSMLMCYLRVCPFTKPIGQDCTIEKKQDQCCPVINCPEEDVRMHTDQKKLLVPVSLVTPSAPSSTTQATTSLAPISDSTELVPYERGCEMNGKYYADGAQVEGDPSKPCELCYCIRNRTACVMQECILHVEGCEPVFQPGVCCPVRYRCDYPPQITDESSSTIASVITTTIQSIFQTTPQPGGCFINGEYYADGSRIPAAERSPCEHCYCMRGEPVCAVQECGAPLENEAGNCTAVPPPPGHCCPEKFTCGDSEQAAADESLSTPMAIVGETTPAPESVPSESAISNDSPVPEAQTEVQSVSEAATTVLPIEPVEAPVDSDKQVQADQPEEAAAPDVLPTTQASLADDKVESVPTTASPVPEGDVPAVADQQDDDVVPIPTEASVPPQRVTESQPQVPTEPTDVPGATDGPAVVSQDDNSVSSTSESILATSSPTSEAADETIFGTTTQPEPIPSENLQRPSSEKPVEDEPQQGTSSTATSVPSEEASATPVRAETTTTPAPRPVMPDMPEIIDVGSSEEDTKPSELPAVSTQRPASDSQSDAITESSSTETPVAVGVTENEGAQQDEGESGQAAAATESPTSSAPSAAAATEPTQSGSSPVSESQNDAVPPTTSQRPIDDDVESGSGSFTTQASPLPSDSDTSVSDSVSSDEPASLPTTSERPAGIEAADGITTPSSPPFNDDTAVQGGTTQFPPQRETATELPSSSDIAPVEDESIAQQDETATTLRPAVPPTSDSPVGQPVTSSSAKEPITDAPIAELVTDSPTGAPATDAPINLPVSDEGSQESSSVDSSLPVVTSDPSLPEEQNEVTTRLPESSEKPLVTESAPITGQQGTTLRPNILPTESPEDNEIISDQGGASNAGNAEQPVAESSTENVIVSQPVMESTTLVSTGQLEDETVQQSTPGSVAQDDNGLAPVETETERNPQDAAQTSTEAPRVPPSQDEPISTDPTVGDATGAPETITVSPSQDVPSESGQDEADNIQQDGPVTTLAPEVPTSPFPDSGSAISQSTSSADEAAGDQEISSPEASAKTTMAPSVVSPDSQPAQAQTTLSPVGAVDGADQDEPSQTTQFPSAVSGGGAEEARPTTERPAELESATTSDDIEAKPEAGSSVRPSQEQPSPTQLPEVTTVSALPIELASQSSMPTESSSETLGDEAVTDAAVTEAQPAVPGLVKEPSEEPLAPTTIATPDSAISSDEPGVASTLQPPVPAADEAAQQVVSEETPVTPPSPVIDEVNEVLGVESVSNSPEGSENLSMLKTSTVAPTSQSESGVMMSSVPPVTTAPTVDSEINSDGTSVEDQSSSAASVDSLGPSSESSTATSFPSAESGESSSAPAGESSSAAAVGDSEATTPAVAPPISEVDTGASGITQSPDLDHPAPETNEVYPVGAQQDTPQEPETPVSTLAPMYPSVPQEDEVPTTSAPRPAPSSDDVASNQPLATEAASESSTTSSVQQSKEPQDIVGAGGVDSSQPANDASATTPSPVVSQDDSSSGVTTEAQTSSNADDELAPSQSDDSGVSGTNTEPSSSPTDQGSTTLGPLGDAVAQEAATEPAPIPEQPDDGISATPAQDPVGQELTSPSPANVVSDVKDQVANEDEPPQMTTVEPDDAIRVVSTIRPQEIADDKPATELPAEVSNEPAVTLPPSDLQDQNASTAPVSVDATTVASVAPATDDSEIPISDAKPSDVNPEEGPIATTQYPVSGQQEVKESDVAATTTRPVQSAEGSTVLPVSDEPSVTASPGSSAPVDEIVTGTQVPAVVGQQDEPGTPTTTPQSSASQSPSESSSAETEAPEDSEEVKHPDDNTDDGDSVTEARPPVSIDNQTEGPAPQQDDQVTTQSSVAQDQPDVSPQATTQRPDAESPTTQISTVHEGGSESQADAAAATEGPSVTAEQTISMQPDGVQSVMSSTEKVEMDSGSSTTESSTDEDVDSSSTDSNVPGEGSCFVEGKTYRNGSSIPPTTACHIACACKNSIVHCLLVHCPPPPARYVDCKPIYRNGVCCPEYDCGSTDEVSQVTVTPEPPFADNKDDTVVTVTPEQQTSTPSSESLVSQQQENAVRPTTESEIGIQDQPSEGVDSMASGGIGTTIPPPVSANDQTAVTSVPAEQVSSTTAASPPAQQDDSSTEPAAGITTTPPASSSTSEQPSDIEQIMDSFSSSAAPEMAGSSSDVAADEDDQSLSSTTGPSAGSQYPVTTTTTVTPSMAPWPYPTSSTPPPGAMSSGACLFDGRVYMSAQQIPREDPCDFCFCFRGDIICLQQSCPPPIPGCYEEPIPGFCCPRYECPVGNGNHTTPPPLFPPSYYHNQILNNAAGGSQNGGSGMAASVPSGPGCEIQGEYFETGQVITSTSGPCLECRCGSTGMMECDPRECQPEPMLRKMIAAITSRRR